MESKSVLITRTAIIAALYVVIGLMIPFMSFGPWQSRISDSLYALIPVLGLPALYGTILGHAIYNIWGIAFGYGLGMFDVLAIFIFIIPKYLIYKFGFKALPIHVIFVAGWVPFSLCMLGFEPWSIFSILVISIGIGEAIAELVLGIPLAKLVEKRL